MNWFWPTCSSERPTIDSWMAEKQHHSECFPKISETNCVFFSGCKCALHRRSQGLADEALGAGVVRWPLRPKQHQFQHLIMDFAVYSNPRHFSCTLDEDLVGRLKKITSHTHPRTMSVRVLQHYALCACHRWVGQLFH